MQRQNTATWLEMYQTVFYEGGALKRWLIQQYDCSINQNDFHVKIIKARYLSCLFMFKCQQLLDPQPNVRWANPFASEQW